MMFTVGRHLQVLLETPESRTHREAHPRARRRYTLACTCSQKRKPTGHCVHTLALFENSVYERYWRDITLIEMRAKEAA